MTTWSGIPLQEQKIVGHAVRANYLYAGVTDLYMEDTDEDYKTVLESVWHHLVTQKMYLTGGCGVLCIMAFLSYGKFLSIISLFIRHMAMSEA